MLRISLKWITDSGMWITDFGEVERSSERSDVCRSVRSHRCRNGLSISYT